MVLREIHSASLQILKAEEKKKMLRKYPFFKLEVVVGSGRDLIAMDRGGKSHSQILCIDILQDTNIMNMHIYRKERLSK